MNDISAVCKNPEKYGFNNVNSNYKGSSIVISYSGNYGLIKFTNFMFDKKINSYLAEGIVIFKPIDYKEHPNILLSAIELRR